MRKGMMRYANFWKVNDKSGRKRRVVFTYFNVRRYNQYILPILLFFFFMMRLYDEFSVFINGLAFISGVYSIDILPCKVFITVFLIV
jgi:hypothetical protein